MLIKFTITLSGIIFLLGYGFIIRELDLLPQLKLCFIMGGSLFVSGIILHMCFMVDIIIRSMAEAVKQVKDRDE